MQKGFTLVELSIVLVIIGLLIGGILAARSLIESAKIRSAITEIQQFDTAVNNFKTKYNNLPGDSQSFYPDANGDGMIWDGNHDSYQFDGEIAMFWVNLNQTGFDSSKVYRSDIDNSKYNNSKQTPNLPTSKLGKDCSYLAYTQTSEGLDAPDFRTTYFLARHGGTTALNPRHYACLTIMQAYALDLKIDDGISTTGATTRGSGYTTTGNGITLDASNPNIQYDPSITTISAALRINILSQVGNQD